MEQLVLFEFGRHRLSPPDFSLFLSRYAPEHWPDSPAALRRLRDKLIILFHGFDHDPRELHCIPEVRRFVQAWHLAWPYWLYFLNTLPEVSTLPVLVACRLESVTVIHRDGDNVCQLDCDPREIQFLLDADLAAFGQVADRARLFPDYRREQLTAAYGLFGLQPTESALRTAGAMPAV